MGLSDPTDDPTAPVGKRLSDTLTDAERRGRKKAVAVATKQADDPTAYPDGGLSLAALTYAASNPTATAEQVERYDRRTEPYRRGGRDDLPARGPPGDLQTNLRRTVEVNAFRAALRRYEDLEDRTD